jgi:hypothetical protein
MGRQLLFWPGNFSKNYFLFKMISAAMTPGTQPAIVKRKTSRMDPQPSSRTARGGKTIAKITLKILMCKSFCLKRSTTGFGFNKWLIFDQWMNSLDQWIMNSGQLSVVRFKAN